jgi:hypothetical protein
LIDSKVKGKWKGSKTAITSLAIDPSSKYLLFASKTISIWDLKTKSKIKVLKFKKFLLFYENIKRVSLDVDWPFK